MDFSRRGFLKLLGIGAAGTLVKPTLAPLFGSDEVQAKPLIIPGASQGLGNHLVYYCQGGPFTSYASVGGHGVKEGPGTLITPDERNLAAQTTYEEAKSWSRVPRLQAVTVSTNWDNLPNVTKRTWEPGAPSLNDRVDISRAYHIPNELIVSPPYVEGMDPHAVFYQAALEVRKRFTEESRQLLLGVSEHLRPRARLVTRVFNEIYARPKGTMSGRTYDEQKDQGFEVVADYHTTISYMEDPLPAGSTVYSPIGEYPIDVPSDIEMGILMRLDREIITDPGKLKRRGFFQLWRP